MTCALRSVDVAECERLKEALGLKERLINVSNWFALAAQLY